MKTIWKFPLEITDYQEIKMPCGAEILSAQVQDRVLCLWAVVGTLNSSVTRRIYIFGTGNPMAPGTMTPLKHIDTVQMGILVWHVFEEAQ